MNLQPSFALLLAFLLFNPALGLAADLTLETVAIYNIKDVSKDAEIIGIQKSTGRIALSCSSKGTVD